MGFYNEKKDLKIDDLVKVKPITDNQEVSIFRI